MLKKLEIIVKTEKLDELKKSLSILGIKGFMITNIMGAGNQDGYTQVYRGEKYEVNLIPRIKVETVVKDEIYNETIDCIIKAVSSGNVGDGKIFVYDVYDAVRIRDGIHGDGAI